MTQSQKYVLFFGQCLLSVLALGWVYHKLDPKALATLVQNFQIFPWFLAFALYNLAQVLSAKRCQLFLEAVGMNMTFFQHLQLYYLGMFYQLFIPGGLGGDGVRVYCMRKHFDGNTLSLVRALFLDRLSGFMALLMLTTLALIGLPIPITSFAYEVSATLAVLAMLLLFGLGRLFFSVVVEHTLQVYVVACCCALGVQLLQVMAALCLLMSFGQYHDFQIYAVVFFLSSVFSQLPVSVSGLGTREIAVMWLLTFFGLAYDAGVAMAFAFFCIQSMSNCLGLLCYRYEPDLRHSTVG